MVPADLAAAIAADPLAQAMFDVLNSTNRFALISRLNSVKRAETRSRKIAEYVAILARGESLYPSGASPPNPANVSAPRRFGRKWYGVLWLLR